MLQETPFHFCVCFLSFLRKKENDVWYVGGSEDLVDVGLNEGI